MTMRIEQAAAEIRRVVQEVLARGLNDPRVRGLISVTDVRLSGDMADATVMVSILPQEQGALTMHGLHHAAPHVRRQIAQRLAMRRIPRLSFKLDESLKRQAAVEAACIAARNGDHPGSQPESDSDGGLPA